MTRLTLTRSCMQHEFQGHTSLNLLGGLNEEYRDPPDAASFIIRSENVQIY